MKRAWTIITFLTLASAFALVPGLRGGAAEKHKMAMREFSSSGIPDRQTAELVKLLKTASKEVRKIVLDPAGTVGGKEFKRGRYAQISDQIDRELLLLKAKVRPWAKGAASKAVGEGRVTANRQAKEAGIAGEQLSGSFNLIDVGTVNVFARQIVRDLDKAADSLGDNGKRWIRETQQAELSQVEISRILANGVITGQPVQTIKRLKDALEAVHGERVSFNDKNGNEISFEVGYYAELVARTQTRMATVAARHERLEELGIDLVAIVGKVSDNFCTAFLGQVFSLSGKSDKYPAYDSLPGGGPPFHPNCSKSTRPFVEELATEKQLDHAEILDDSEQLLGMNQAEAQKAFKDLQIRQQVSDRYARSA